MFFFDTIIHVSGDSWTSDIEIRSTKWVMFDDVSFLGFV